jgi:hypothetical protein
MARIIIFSTLWGIALKDWGQEQNTGSIQPVSAGELDGHCGVRKLRRRLTLTSTDPRDRYMAGSARRYPNQVSECKMAALTAN